MTKSPSRKLKVFQAQIGFHDTVVAAPSQAAALRAWGIRQNLFASGDARITLDNKVVAAALEYPEKPLLRAVGSGEPFSLEPTRLPKIPDAPKKRKPEKAAKPKATLPPAADRSLLNVAEATLRGLDEKRKQEAADERRDEEAAEARRAAAQASYVKARKQASAAVVAARQTYRRAGGID